jgi:hypothetical protein
MTMSITEMKAKNPNWFSKEAMRFFSTKIEAKPNKKGIFITSEQFDENAPRKYTLRKFNTETNMVDTVGEFQGYNTLAEAREARK